MFVVGADPEHAACTSLSAADHQTALLPLVFPSLDKNLKPEGGAFFSPHAV